MSEKKAKLYRMATREHICPFGIRSKYLLKNKGYEVEDHPLKNKQEIEDFKNEFNVQTTPQVFISDQRIGGYEDLRKFFGEDVNGREKSYWPVTAVFTVAMLMSLSINYVGFNEFSFMRIIEMFVAFSMCLLSVLKLNDLYSFTNQFITYDILAQKVLPYAYLYPFIELVGGLSMITKLHFIFVAPVILIAGLIGAASVFKTVYLDKRHLKCACVGGNSNVPLGFVSLMENITMILMAIWMITCAL